MPPFVLTVLKIALLALLYFFVYRAVRAVVLDLYGPPEARRARTEPRQRAARRTGGVPTKLLILDERGAKLGTQRLTGTIQIGRSPACQIRLDRDNYISQLHAKISQRNGSWVIEDLGSTNGTYLNQRRVTVPTEIAPGDRIRVGKTTLEVRK